VLSKIVSSALHRSHKCLTTVEMVLNVAILLKAVCGERKASWRRAHLAAGPRSNGGLRQRAATRRGPLPARGILRELVKMCVASGGFAIAAFELQ
jgi:hypothetical protein